MTHIAFDTLAYANKLKKAGVKPEAAEVQAEATAEILSDLVNDKLATKDSLNSVVEILNSRISAVESKLTWLVSLFGLIGIFVGLLNAWHIYFKP